MLLDELVRLFDLEQRDDLHFVGHNHDIGSGRIFGGQVLGQAIAAAQRTVDNRPIHSAHAYFVRAGDLDKPVHYRVENDRDGKSYSARTIRALQDGKVILTMMCSFHIDEASELEYAPAIDTQAFSSQCDTGVNMASDTSVSQHIQSRILNQQPLLFRFPNKTVSKTQANEQFCLKTNGPLPASDNLHRSLLAYLSDFRLLASSLRPSEYRFRLDNIQLASLCHAIWFHRPCPIDEWLYAIYEPQSLSNGRGLAKGSIYNHEGILAATTIQEGVIRIKR